ncbi:family 78 glycoside hydrolase catalytic domain [Dyadobacter tibetensis]|uniref:family 78 glycoside hydrolase catalytic domain n=1 Tax=Dyadobacter tibetensis TaxID=1211851 RepID=UPI0018DE8729|nr:family 78 glycoside hydrolase catalytic domain [Dyadobacter tibetensis]
MLCLTLTESAPLLAQGAAPRAPHHLRVFDKTNPIGTGDRPYFGWYVSDPDINEVQSAYQILVASTPVLLNADRGDIWDSGKIPSRKQNYVYILGQPLKSSHTYYWKVRTWDKDDLISPYAEPATFTTGLTGHADWAGASWIRRKSDSPDDYTYYRKSFALPRRQPKSAIVYLAAHHSYDLYVNGQRVGKGFNHHYPQYAYYQAWDIAPYLKPGQKNVIACLTHWYGGGQGRAKAERGLLLKALVDYGEGDLLVVGSDSSWKQAQAMQWVTGQPQRNGEGIGRIEKIDSRKAVKGWNAIGFDDSVWEQAIEIGAHPAAPWTGTLRPDLTRVIEKEIKPVSVKKMPTGKYLIDLGKIYAGSFKIAFHGGKSGDSVKVQGGFVLQGDGSISTDLDQQTNLEYHYILNGESSVFQPHVYLGLRYLEVENSPNMLDADHVTFITRHYELDPSRSSFTSSDSTLNRVWDLMVHSLVVGAQEGFMDTPTREKGGFLGDSWSQGVPNLSVMGDRTMNLRILNEFLDSQEQYWPDGRLNAVYPNVDGARDIPEYTQSYLVWAWDYYMQTGNAEFLKKNYDRLRQIARYVDAHRDEDTGLIYKLAGGKGPYENGIIDWPLNMRYGYDMDATSRTVINAYAYADFLMMARIAAVAGMDSDISLYEGKASAMKEAMNARLVNEDGVYIDGLYQDRRPSGHVSQHANIIPLALDMVPKANRQRVIAAIKERQMQVGMICLRWLPEALGEAGEGEHLMELYTNSDWDGWARTLKLGGTVTWESWNANEVNESMSHPWGAVGLLGMQQYMLGIKPLEAQHDLVQIKPLWFGDKLKTAGGIYPTDKGNIKLDWQYENGRYTLKIDLPVNIKAKVYLPGLGRKDPTLKVDGETEEAVWEGEYLMLDGIGSGTHIFERTR